MKNTKTILLLTIILLVSANLYAQTGGPGPPPPTPTGVPIDGLSGLIMMGLAAIFGKKFMKKEK